MSKSSSITTKHEQMEEEYETTFQDIEQTTILTSTFQRLFNQLFHKKEVDQAYLENKANIKLIVNLYETKVDTIFKEKIIPALKRKFKIKSLLIDQYGETHRQDVLRLFIHYNSSYIQFIDQPLHDVQKLYHLLFLKNGNKGRKYTQDECYDAMMFVIKYMMVLDMMRKDMLIGNVRLFKSTHRYVSSWDVVNQTVSLCFDEATQVMDIMRKNGLELTQEQYPQYCQEYTFGVIEDLTTTGIELSVLASYLANKMYNKKSDIMKSLQMDTNAILTRKQATENINHLVGLVTSLGMPFKIGSITFYDHVLYDKEDDVVPLFLFEFLKLFKCPLAISKHVVMNEITRISGIKMKPEASRRMYDNWVAVIGRHYGKQFTFEDYDYFIPYLYILCYYCELPIPHYSTKGTPEKRRQSVFDGMKDALEQLHIPQSIFIDKNGKYDDKDYIQFILSFLFYYTQKIIIVDCAANCIARAMKKCVERKQMEKQRKFVSSLFTTITFAKALKQSHDYNEIEQGVQFIQQNTVKLQYDTMITNIKEVQREMKRVLLQQKMTGITKHVEDVQSVCRRNLCVNEMRLMENEIQQTQAIMKGCVGKNKYEETIQCGIQTQANARECIERNNWNQRIETNQTTQKEMRCYVDELQYNTIVNSTIDCQSIMKEKLAKLQFEQREKMNVNTQSVMRSSISHKLYNDTINSSIQSQTNARTVINKTHYDNMCQSSTDITKELMKIYHSANYNKAKRVTPDVQSYYRSLIKTKEMNDQISQTINAQSLCRQLLSLYEYNTMNSVCLITQSESRRMYDELQFKMIEESQKETSALLRMILDKKQYEEMKHSCEEIQSFGRTKYQKQQYDTIVDETQNLQSSFKMIYNTTQFNEIRETICQIVPTIRSYISVLESKNEFERIQQVQAIIKGNMQKGYYNQIVENIQIPQTQMKQVLYTTNYNISECALKYIQNHSRYSLHEKGIINTQSIMRQILIPSFKKNREVTKEVEGIMREELIQREFNQKKEAIVNTQSVLKSLLKKKEYTTIVHNTQQTQAVWKKVLLQHEQEVREYACKNTQAVIRETMVRNETELELHRWYKECNYRRHLVEFCVPVQALCRQKIVKYGIHLDEEVMQSLSYSCEVYKQVHDTPQEIQQVQKKVRASESPTKALQSPSQRILPKPLIQNTIFLNKPTRISLVRIEEYQKRLYEYIRKTNKSVIDIAFANIRMMERKKLDEIQVGANQLFEQIKTSEWFGVMFIKYKCIFSLLDLLKSSNKSQPFLDLIEKSCRMIQILITNEFAFELYQQDEKMINQTVVVISDILRNHNDIKVLREATKAMIALYRKKKDIKDQITDLCSRLKTKLNEIETKENAEKKRQNAIALKMKKEFVYESASVHIKNLLNMVLNTRYSLN